MRRTVRVTLWAILTVFIVTSLILISTNILVSRSARAIKTDIQAVEPSTVAIVLGAKVYEDGSLSAVLADRVDTSIDLYQSGKVKKLLMSGDHGQKSYDEVNAMRARAVEQGVPESDIFTDHAGFSTYESMVRAKKVFKVSDAVIVSQEFHLPRALFVANDAGLKAQALVADRRPYLTGRASRFREYVANVKAVWETTVNARPTYLGPAIPITGDGRASRG